MSPSCLPPHIAALPKAELHLHLEGSIQPATVCALTARHGIQFTEADVRQRYSYSDFAGFIDAFKWVTSFLREPSDYAFIAQDLAEHLLTQNVIYAELTLSVGVMLLRKQWPEANFEAILRATEPFEKRGLRLNWIFDAVRQFGPEPAMDVVNAAKNCGSKAIVAFGIGGDELSVATEEFRSVYQRAAQNGLHLLMHAGEVGGPEKIREAVELLHVERIGHGIAAAQDPALMDLLAERLIPLEICPASNICTGALAKQLGTPSATIEQHPLPKLLRHGIPIVLSTDDPAMFHTSLLAEYENAARMGLTETELFQLAQMSFDHAFLPVAKKHQETQIWRRDVGNKMYSITIAGNVEQARTEAEISQTGCAIVAVVYEASDGWHTDILEKRLDQSSGDFGAIVNEAQERLSHYVNRKGQNAPENSSRGAFALWLMMKDDGTAIGMKMEDRAES